MKKVKYILQVMLVVLVTILLLHSETTFAKVNKIDQANDAYRLQLYNDAVVQYQDVLAAENNHMAEVRLAHSYRMMNAHTEAVKWYTKASMALHLDSVHMIYFAKSLMQVGKIEEAEQWFETYLQVHPNSIIAENGLLSCQNYDALEAKESVYSMRPLKLNSIYNEFGAVMMGNQLVFASDRPNGKLVKNTYQWNGGNFLDIHVVQARGASSWEAESSLLRGASQTGKNDGPVSFTADMRTMYFSRSAHGDGNELMERQRLQIMVSQWNDYSKVWSKPEAMEIAGAQYEVTHPAVSADGKRLYFASNKSGGQGGMDIWYMEKIGEVWSQPKNMGPLVNTPGDEAFPFVDAEGRFYFASNTHIGLGGMDIFEVEVDRKGEITGVLNMGMPINSKADDFGFFYNTKRSIGFISSNRTSGKGNDDIYMISCDRSRLKVALFSQLQEPVANAEVTLNVANGVDLTEYTNKEGFIDFDISNQSVYGIQVERMEQTVAERAIRIQSDDRCVNRSEVFTINNEIDQDVFGVLIDQETKLPIANARVEMSNKAGKLVDHTTTDRTGAFMLNVKEEGQYTVDVEAANYEFDPVSMIISSMIRQENLRLAAKNMQPTKSSRTLAFNAIDFDLNSDVIRPAASADLDVMVDILKLSPELNVELGAHSDARGNDKYNQSLSERRAKSVVRYLVDQGIAPNRLKARGYGESMISNHCIDGVSCSDNEHRANRRVEFKVL